jgi:hypothetical protein
MDNGTFPLRRKIRTKTGFITPFGSYRYERMPFGLSGSPSTFSKVMDATLLGLKDVECLVYLDDILIYSPTIDDHARGLRLVFDRIRDANFKLNVAKCTYAAPQVAYLGHTVSKHGVAPDEGKVRAIRNFPLPRTVKDVRAFLGLAGYYRSFIQDFAATSRPLTLLTRKDTRFEWTPKQQEAFDKLKAALSSESVLAHPNFELPFILSCDASNYAISAILSQKQNGQERPISFASRVLNEHEVNYSTTHKELLAVIFGTKIHRCFLYGRKFQIVTDHAALKWLITVKNHQCARLTRWVLKLSEYEFEIIHKPGKKHVNVDVLSQHIATVHSFQENAETTDELDLTHNVILREQRTDEYCQRQLEKVRNETEVDFSIDNTGILHFGKENHDRRIVIPQTLVHTVIEYHHDKVYAGHQGITRTQTRKLSPARCL